MTGSPALDARIRRQRGAIEIDVTLTVTAGETVAVVGPNGAGKTSVLRALVGLDGSGGAVLVDGEPASVAGLVELVFQDTRLFPHLDARDNVAFPLRARGHRRPAAREVATSMLDRLGVPAGAHARRPSELSGGEAQRVALARALVTEPRVLLLDEPFAALDVETRPRIRSVVRDALASFGGAAVIVTHDPTDALVLADRVAVLEAGRITQVASVAEIARAPRTPYAARVVGTNLLRGAAADGVVHTDDGLLVAIADRTASGAVGAVIPPTAVTIHDRPEAGSARNCWAGTVDHVELLGDRARVGVRLDPSGTELVAEVTVASLQRLGLDRGRRVYATVKATEIETAGLVG